MGRVIGAGAADRRLLRAFAVAVGCLAAVVALLVLIGGWVLGLGALRTVAPGLASMKVNTALAIFALGAGLVLVTQRGRVGALGKLAAAFSLAVGLITLAEYLFHWNAGIDELIVRDPDTLVHPGRPALVTAVSLALYGVALLCARIARLRHVKSAAGLIGTLFSWAAVNGYVFGGLQTVPLFSSIAVHTALISLLLGLGVLATEATFWPLRMTLESSPGGIVCRWLLPPAILAPPALGWLFERAAMFSVYPPGFRWALYSAVASLGSVWLVTMLASRIAALDAQRSAAAELSRHDPLTGLANRRAFDAFLLECFSLARRYRHPLSLILLDVDRFKSYNDAYGHPAGDELLRSLGGLLASVGRETDLIARIGGEEFAIVLPETDLAGAEAVAERVRAVVERATSFRRSVTVSLGVAAITADTTGPATLVHDCDAALYQAKGGGRNRVATAIAA